MVYATDTGVVVIAVAVSRILQNCEVWIAFGHGNKLNFIPCHRIANKFGTDASCGLLFFSTLCQVVILFQHSLGVERKQLGYLAQYVSPRSDFRSVITCTKANTHRRFKAVGKSCCSPVSAHIPLSIVNNARKQMFTQNRRIDNIIPTLLALDQNVKRAAYQAVHIWGQSLIGTLELPPQQMWAWQRETDDAI